MNVKKPNLFKSFLAKKLSKGRSESKNKIYIYKKAEKEDSLLVRSLDNQNSNNYFEDKVIYGISVFK